MTNVESEIAVSRASESDAVEVHQFLQQFVDAERLLPRTVEELKHLTKFAFIARRAEKNGEQSVVGFSAVEVYSKKLAEIQCMAVCPTVQRMGLGRTLVQGCVELAKAQGVRELMAISSSEDFLQSCGFHYSLPHQKRAFFIEPQKTDDN